ncbi:MAG: LysR family transcriptional regulator, partial [Firmicutes bacterium]|nr:LysR family transcriptional regulator [Bacillota bacterium]
QAFVVVAELGSFTKAASVLYLTQPTLSRQIADLEEELGVPLFVRKNHSLTLTEAGARCLPSARGILRLCENMAEDAREVRETAKGHLHIGYFIGTESFQESLVAFQHVYPGVDLNITSMSLERIIQALKNGKVDLIYCIKPMVDSPGNMVFVPTEDAYLQLIVSRDHPLASQERIDIEDLKDESFIMYERNAGTVSVDYMQNLCRQAGFLPNIRKYVKDVPSMMFSVGSSDCVAFAASYLEINTSAHVKFLDLYKDGERIPTPLGFSYLDKCDNPAVELFLKLITSIK